MTKCQRARSKYGRAAESTNMDTDKQLFCNFVLQESTCSTLLMLPLMQMQTNTEVASQIFNEKSGP